MFLFSFVLCVYDIVYQIFHTMSICYLTVVKVWISLLLDEKYNVERFLCNLYKLKRKFEAAQEILVLIAHDKCIFNHPYWCSRDSVLKFGLCLHLHTYFVYRSSKGSVVSNYTFSPPRLLLHCSTLGYELQLFYINVSYNLSCSQLKYSVYIIPNTKRRKHKGFREIKRYHVSI